MRAIARPYTDLLRQALRVPRYRWLGAVAGAGYLLVYLLALGQLVIDPQVVPAQGTPSFVLLPGWSANLLKPIAGSSFEPIGAFYPVSGVTFLIAPLNLFIGGLLAALVALNVATAAHALAIVRSCRRASWSGMLGSLPGLLTGFACCVPTVALVLGANLTLALISLQGFLLPVSAATLLAGLAWNLHRTSTELLQARA